MKKHFLLYLLILSLLFSSILPIQSYATTDSEVIYNTDTYIDYEAEKAFIEGINNRSNQIYIPTMNEENMWCLFNVLIYKYMPEAYTQSWIYEKYEDDLAGLYVYWIGYSGNRYKYYIMIKDYVYDRYYDPNYCNEYDEFIDDVIKKANINEDMTQDEIILNLVNYIATAYRYDAEFYLNTNIPKWQIVRDYGISVCESDSKIAKACLDKFNIDCRLVRHDGHMWIQVKRNGEWEAIDITNYRACGKRFMYFDDNYLGKVNILN